MIKTPNIFGEYAKKERSKPVLEKLKRREKLEGIKVGLEPLMLFRTPIEKYPLKLNFLLNEIKRAKKEGRVLKVLDVGIGSGLQWSDFLKRHKLVLGHDIDLFGSSLTRRTLPTKIKEEFRHRIRQSRGDNLARRFKEHIGTFDIVLNNLGTFDQQLTVIENVHPLLRNGGHYFTDTNNHTRDLEHYFKIHLNRNNHAWLHLEKRAARPSILAVIKRLFKK